MSSAVRSRPNHYDILGLAPQASADDIARAFAKEMSIAGAQPIGAAAKICAAYETLRDPARRKDYDRSIGIAPAPEPQSLQQWAFPAPQSWAPMHASAKPAVAASPESKHEPEPDPIAERASRIADTLRELARPIEAAPPPKPAEPDKTDYSIEPDIRELLGVRSEETADLDDRSFDWRRPAMAVGGLVVAAGLLGAVAGLWVRGDTDPAQTEPALTTSLPAARAHAVTAAPEPAVEAAHIEGHARAAVPTVRANRAAPPQQLAQRPSVESKPIDNQFVESATEQAAAQDPLAPAPVAAAPEPAVAAAADLPLPGKLVARTIERIGYSCGSVTSSAAVDGANGVFKVTCSSGQTYRAAPVHGRYRFKRWSGE
jgi:hypothetical protein